MVFEEHVDEFLVGLRQAALVMTPGEKSYSVEQIRQQHPKAYARWTEAETSDLKRAHAEGKTTDELAKLLGRQPGAIRSRLQRMGLI